MVHIESVSTLCLQLQGSGQISWWRNGGLSNLTIWWLNYFCSSEFCRSWHCTWVKINSKESFICTYVVPAFSRDFFGAFELSTTYKNFTKFFMKILHESKNDSSDLISTPFLVRGMAQCLCVSCKSIISCYFWGLVALRYYSFWKCPCHCPEYIFQKSSKLLCKNFNVKIAVLDLELEELLVCWVLLNGLSHLCNE